MNPTTIVNYVIGGTVLRVPTKYRFYVIVILATLLVCARYYATWHQVPELLQWAELGLAFLAGAFMHKDPKDAIDTTGETAQETND